jgi:hypothetical protein
VPQQLTSPQPLPRSLRFLPSPPLRRWVCTWLHQWHPIIYPVVTHQPGAAAHGGEDGGGGGHGGGGH